jgi:SNF2 family DNA or RNA helicase
MPVLTKTVRCVLLSGTPALARPAELWPQLCILGTQRYGWWEDEAEFIDKYVKKTSSRRRAELHTMLAGTVMIRRLKVDILKTLPKKRREKAIIHVVSSQEQRDEFKHLLNLLRKGKGAMGKLARAQHTEDRRGSKEQEETYQPSPDSNVAATAATNPVTLTNADLARKRDEAERALKADIQQRLANGRASMQNEIVNVSQRFGEEQGRQLHETSEQNLLTELDNSYRQELAQINQKFALQQEVMQQTERTAVLSRLYSLSGDVKIPLIVDMLNRWLDDPTKGKICIFAHHISVLDAIGQRARLSNNAGSSRKFIRIDGSTSPKLRQQQISAYQSDPLIRVALLGITAAGESCLSILRDLADAQCLLRFDICITIFRRCCYVNSMFDSLVRGALLDTGHYDSG